MKLYEVWDLLQINMDEGLEEIRSDHELISVDAG